MAYVIIQFTVIESNLQRQKQQYSTAFYSSLAHKQTKLSVDSYI